MLGAAPYGVEKAKRKWFYHMLSVLLLLFTRQPYERLWQNDKFAKAFRRSLMSNYILHYRGILRSFCWYHSFGKIIKPLCIVKGMWCGICHNPWAARWLARLRCREQCRAERQWWGKIHPPGAAVMSLRLAPSKTFATPDQVITKE